jgi:tRNA (guanine-N7-)-methyltransferase
MAMEQERTQLPPDLLWLLQPHPGPASSGLDQRVRNHVNPLSALYATPASPPHWEQMYARLDQPFHLDIGTGTGRFLLAMAHAHPNWNFLGVEIRRPLVERANRWCQDLQLDNVTFLFANINVTLPHLFAPGDLARVSIQFPDPWFKKRHQKRRVVQPQLIEELARLMQDEGQVFLQSDIEEVAVEMATRFHCHPSFHPSPPGLLAENPLPIPTLREVQCLRQGLPVYRYAFVCRYN